MAFVRITTNTRNGNTYREDTVGKSVADGSERLAAEMGRPGYIHHVLVAGGHIKLIPMHALESIDVTLVEGEPQFPWRDNQTQQ
jgi:hypothetical protein